MSGRQILYLLIFVVFAVSCNESKHLADGQNLWVGNKVEIKSMPKLAKKKEKEVRAELSDLVRPKPNGKVLGIRFKHWIYNIAGKPKKNKGFKYWLKNKVGEPPVLATPSLIEKNRAIMQNHLENKGFFRDTVISSTHVKNKKLTAIYTAEVGPQYIIRNVGFGKDTSAIDKQIDTLKRRSLLKKGDPYDLDVIKAERERIDTRLKNRGFYSFSADYLVVELDTAVGDHQVDMAVKIKEGTPPEAKNVYHINNVTVFAEYGLHMDTTHNRGYVTPEGYRIIDTAKLLRPIVFRKTLVLKPGNIYKTSDVNSSLSRLVSLGVFKFVKIRFQPQDTSDANDRLNTFYYLTPSARKSIRFEASGLTRSDNTTGGELALQWRNRNFLRGAELFTASLFGGLEQQRIGGGVTVNTQRYGIDLNLYIPRIISPIPLNTSAAFVPKTRINAGYEIFNRSTEYTLTSAKGSFGYIFKNSLTTENQVTVLGINYVRPTSITPTYQKQLDSNIMLARAIERQFIIGPSYNFNYNSQARPNRRMNNYYFNGNVDLSGNLMGLFSGADVRKGKERTLFNVPFAQYVRFEADFRHYLSFNKYTMIASRVTGGMGIAYGNSYTMPFIKQFFAGGANDIRAFRSRALGPGSYYAGDPNKKIFLPDQPGDVKLEANVEYRTKLFSIVRWAFFADAGNIWTREADSSRPGSQFTSHFLDDMAVGIGTGLRFDLSILVLRIDFAVPVRVPWLAQGDKWQFRRVSDISNYVLNLAIGYPF